MVHDLHGLAEFLERSSVVSAFQNPIRLLNSLFESFDVIGGRWYAVDASHQQQIPFMQSPNLGSLLVEVVFPLAVELLFP